MGDTTIAATNYQREEEDLELPPGFRFHPTDEEIITSYLTPKVLNHNFIARAIGEVDLNKSEPWDLPSKAKMGEKEYYFFWQRDRKYPTGMRTNRATDAGYWKATGKDKEVFRGRNVLVGMKKTLVFYKGRAPKGVNTNWVMHEYRLEGRLPFPSNQPRSSKDEWVVCRIFHKSTGIKKSPMMLERPGNSIGEDYLADSNALPNLVEPPSYFGNSSGMTTAATSSQLPTSSYLATILGNNFDNNMQLQELNVNNQFGMASSSSNSNNNNNFYSQFGMAASNTNYSYMPMPGYEQQQQQQQQCKVEPQYSNQQSMVSARSQETGLSTDRNSEISSVLSRQNFVEDVDLDGPLSSSVVAGIDLDNMWKY